jgi:hypothetical protein
MNLSSKELAVASQSQLDGFKNPNKRAMLGAMGINVGNVQEAQGIKSILQSAVAGQGAQQMAPGGSIVDRMAMAVKAKVDQQKQQEEMMKVAMGFRGMEPANGVGSLPVPGQDYAEGGIVPFAKGGQPKVAAKEESFLDSVYRKAEEDYRQRMSAIPEIERPNEAKIREDYTNRDIEVSKPYVDKMDALMREAFPNTEGIRNQNRSNSIITAGLQMLQARGGPGFAGGLAGIAGGAQRGLNQYQEGDRNLQGQLQKHRAFQMEGIKNELGMRRDRMKYAEDAVRNAEREYGIDSRERKAAVAAAERARTDFVQASIKAEQIRQKEIADAARNAATDRRLDIIAARSGPGGGGAGNRNTEWDRRQALAEYRIALKDSDHPAAKEYKTTIRQSPEYKAADEAGRKRMLSEGYPEYAASWIERNYGTRPYPNAAGIRSVAPTAPAAAPQTKPKLKLFE